MVMVSPLNVGWAEVSVATVMVEQAQSADYLGELYPGYGTAFS